MACLAVSQQSLDLVAVMEAGGPGCDTPLSVHLGGSEPLAQWFPGPSSLTIM